MESAIFEQLQQTLGAQGADAAIRQLCQILEERKDYGNLFYALLLKRRHELGVSPVPTEPSQALPEAAHVPYEEGIREAGRKIGNLYLSEADIPRAWMYFRMLGEIEPVARALDRYELGDDESSQQVIEIAFHQGANPRKGFDWILQRYGLCNAITTLSSHDLSHAPDVREHCIRRLVQTLYAELLERLRMDIAQGGAESPAGQTVRQILESYPERFEDEFYHVDVSHLSAVVQMSLHLPPGEELQMARELCVYGQRLSPRFRYAGEPPFEDLYRDAGIYLAILAGDQVEEGLAHFRAKAEQADPENDGTQATEAFVNLLLRVGRDAEALAVARKYLASVRDRPVSCPSIVELCQKTGDYQALAEAAREQGDPVHYLAGLLARKPVGT
jgi:hypothetical protein